MCTQQQPINTTFEVIRKCIASCYNQAQLQVSNEMIEEFLVKKFSKEESCKELTNTLREQIKIMEEKIYSYKVIESEIECVVGFSVFLKEDSSEYSLSDVSHSFLKTLKEVINNNSKVRLIIDTHNFIVRLQEI